MSTELLIDEVLALSGPFVDGRAKRAHRRWLEAKSTDWLLQRRVELNATSQRPAGQGVFKLGLRYAR